MTNNDKQREIEVVARAIVAELDPPTDYVAFLHIAESTIEALDAVRAEPSPSNSDPLLAFLGVSEGPAWAAVVAAAQAYQAGGSLNRFCQVLSLALQTWMFGEEWPAWEMPPVDVEPSPEGESIEYDEADYLDFGAEHSAFACSTERAESGEERRYVKPEDIDTYWKRRYDEQHRTLHSAETALAEVRAERDHALRELELWQEELRDEARRAWRDADIMPRRGEPTNDEGETT